VGDQVEGMLEFVESELSDVSRALDVRINPVAAIPEDESLQLANLGAKVSSLNPPSSCTPCFVGRPSGTG
jgi:hypothetical protein